jgi:hypothetical protein
MFQFLRGIVLIAALSCGTAFGQDTYSANYVIPGCKAGINEEPQKQASLAMTTLCMGLVEGIHYAASGVCTNSSVTRDQLLRVVVKYIDDRPTRLHEDFKVLALEALRAAFPCKR